MKHVIILLITALMISGIAAASCVVVYLDEYGAPYGYLHPDAYDIQSALDLLPTPPTPEQAGTVLTSAIPPGTMLTFQIEGDVGVVTFSQNVVAGLTELQLESIFEQVKGTLYQFGIQGTIKMIAGGKSLSDYLPPVPAVLPRPEAQLPHGLLGVNSLAGRIITVSPGHGKRWNGSYWSTARPVYCSPLNQEDYHNLENAQYLETYLLQDSATVKMVRCTNKSYGNADEYISGEPWWHMGASYWLKNIGYPCEVYGPDGCNLGTGGSDDTNEIQSRPLSSDYDGSDIYISLHTNGSVGDCAGLGCPTGTCTYYDAGTEHAPWGAVSQTLATAVNNSIISAIRTKYVDAGWSNRGVLNSDGGFGEIRIPDRAAILIELAFHDSCDMDALKLRDNFFRSTTMWAVYKGTCDYFGVTPTWDYYSNEFVSHDIPAAMEVGERYTVHVTMRNRGVLWNDAKGFHLGAVGDSDPCSTVTRQTITGEVGPNSTYTFTFTLRAPLATGTYTTDWQMVRDGFQWFGPTVSQTIDVTGIPDTEPPTVPTGLTATPQNEMRVDLSWTASTDDRGVIGYYVYRDDVRIATTTGTGTTYSDGTCLPSITYTYEVSAYDDFFNESGRSLPAQATTPAPSPPTTPLNLHGTGSTTSTISMAWDASTDNIGVVGYRVYRNGGQVGTTAGTTYTDSGLNYTSSYTYEVDAYDGVPSYSARSAPAVLSTTTPSYYTWSVSSSNQDAYIRDGSPDTPGGSAAIQVGWSATTGIGTRRGLVAWNMAGAPAQAAIVNAPGSVRVRLYCYSRYSGTGSNIYLNSVNATWTEAGATWNTMNSAYDQLLATTSVAGIGDYTWSWNGSTLGLPVQSRGVIVRNSTEGGTNATKNFTDREQTGGANPKPRLEVDYYDIVAPTSCSISINSGAAYTISTAVTLTLSATDFPSLMSQMQFSSDGTNYSAPEAYATSKSDYTLPDGDGLKTVYVKYKDVSGNWSAPVADTITLDTSPPTGTIEINSGAVYTSASPVTLTLSSTDSAQMQFNNENGAWSGWETYGTSKSWPLSAGDGAKTVYVELKDAAGNISDEPISAGITLDTTGPSAPTVTDEGTYTPSGSELVANWSGASDAQSGIAQYQYAIGTLVDPTALVEWTPTSDTSVTETGLTLDPDETYYISVKAKNGAGLWSDVATSDGITPVADSGDIADAKALADGEPGGVVALNNKVVTASFGTYFYIEEYDTFSAIRIEAEGPATGSTISVAGVMGTSDCERRITTATVKDGSGALMPPARFMRNANVGGGPFKDYTPGLPGKTGLNNVGLLIEAIGTINYAGAGVIYVDDGSALDDTSGHTGLRVDTSLLSSSKAAELVETWYAILRGIVMTEPTLGDAPLLKLRDDGDVIAVYPPPE